MRNTTQSSRYITGVFEDDEVLVAAVRSIRKEGARIFEVFSPFPIHGIDDALGYKRSGMSIVAFMFGLTGTFVALILQIGMLYFDWPMNIGGKDHLSFPSFIPVTFELTVLLAAFGMVGTFLVVSDLKPWAKPRIFDKRITDDKHVIALRVSENTLNEGAIKKMLNNAGASEVNEVEFDF